MDHRLGRTGQQFDLFGLLNIPRVARSPYRHDQEISLSGSFVFLLTLRLGRPAFFIFSMVDVELFPSTSGASLTTSAVCLHKLSADNAFIFPVRAFDQHVRTDLFDQGQRVRLLENADIIDALQCRQNSGSGHADY